MLFSISSFKLIIKKRFIPLLLLIFSSASISNTWLNEANNNIFFNHITAEHGLPHPAVNAIVQDNMGYIWIATQDGLTRYDGKHFKTYNHSPGVETSLGNNWIWDLYIDTEGRLWAASSGGFHLYIPEIDGFTNFNSKKGIEGIEGASYLSISEAPNGNILFASQFSGFTEFDIRTSTFKTLLNDKLNQNVTNNPISNLIYDKTGNLWITSPKSGLILKRANSNKYETINSTSNKSIPSNKLRTLFVDEENQLWVGSADAGVFVVNQELKVIQHFKFNPTVNDSFCANYVNDIMLDKNKTMWFATENGLCKLNEDGKTFTRTLHQASRNSSLISNRTSKLMQDSGGVIWVGTQSGISRWNASLNYFSHISKNGQYRALSSNSIMAFAKDSSDDVYIGTWNGGVNVFSNKTHIIDKILADPQRTDTLQEDNIMSLLVDDADNLWVGTLRSGLHLRKKGATTFKVYSHEDNNPDSISENAISKILQLSNGQLAVGTYGGGLNLFNTKTEKFSLISLPSSVKDFPFSIYIVDLTEDEKGNIWIATRDGGLLKYDYQSKKITQFLAQPNKKAQLISDDIFGVLNTKDYIWVATKDAGIARLNKAKLDKNVTVFEHIGTQHGLASNFTYGMLEDENGFIWVSHAKGLSRIDSKTFAVINFNTTHGLQGTDFNSSAFYKDKTGRMYFGGSNGFNTFKPENVPINNHKPDLRLTKYSQSNVVRPIHQELREDGVLALNYNKTIVDFEFAALDFTKPENNKYQYKMEGLGDTWINLWTNNKISFSYLDDGDYTLRVKGSNNDNVWSDELVIPIEVLPPLWRTWYSYLTYILVLVTSVYLLVQQQKEKVRRQLAHEQRLHRLAYYDSLTGLPNRQSFYESLEKFLSLAKRGHYQAAVMFIDLDRFKRINDTLGHEYGDLVLQEIAERLNGCIRTSDMVARTSDVAKPDSEIARLGGDEFTLFLSQVEGSEEIAIITQRIIDSISKPIKIENYEVMVTPSIGIAIYPDDGNSVNELMKHADIAMYKAKEIGRRTYSFYAHSLNDKGLEHLKLEEYLRTGIENQEFELHFQPQVDLVNNCVNKAEALVRWRHPELGVVSPIEFIPLAEESGLIIELGEWILRESCFQAKRWLDDGMPCRISVNVSSVQFKQSALIEKVKLALSDSGLPPELLELELTESAIMSDVEDNIIRLQNLKDMGVTIAVDDFGTGYSSLSYLKKFPINTLKIDRSFIIDIADNENDEAIVKAIMVLAESMSLNVVAEGIETLEQLKILHAFHCGLIQGYYFSKPLINDDFVEFVKHGFDQNKSTWQLDLIG
jgi:diguanylate cyclase (GGDEF)-like protein